MGKKKNKTRFFYSQEKSGRSCMVNGVVWATIRLIHHALRPFILLILLVGCAPAIKDLSREEREEITTRTFDYKYTEVFNAIMTVLEDNEYIIANADKSLGLINTDYKTKHHLILGHYRTKFNVRIKKLNKNICQVKLNPIIEMVEFGSWVRQSPSTDFKREYDKYFIFIQEELERK